MVSLTLSITNTFKVMLNRFSWVNWSEVGREESLKKEIFEEYMKTGKLSDKNWKFCEKIDWHPVDELPLKEEYVKELEKRRREKGVRFNSVDELFER